MVPVVVMRPILFPSVNQRLPSGPAVIPSGLLPVGNSVMVPAIAGVVLLVPVAGVVLLVAVGLALPPVPQAVRRRMINPSMPIRTYLRAIGEEMFMMLLSLLTPENNPLD